MKTSGNINCATTRLPRPLRGRLLPAPPGPRAAPLALAALLCLCTAAGAAGQDPASGAAPADEAGEGAFLNVDQFRAFHQFPEGDSRVNIFLGGVHVTFGVTEIWADNVVVWCDRSKTDPKKLLAADDDFRFGVQIPREREIGGEEKEGAILSPLGRGARSAGGKDSFVVLADIVAEIYVEGNLRMMSGADTNINADRFYFNLKENRGVIVDGALRTNVLIRGKPNPLVIRAHEIRQICAGYAVARDASISTCTFSLPHYHLRVESLSLKGSLDDGTLAFEESPDMVLRGVPVPLPAMAFALGQDWPVPLRRLRAGRSSKFGVYGESLWGKDFNQTGAAFQRELGLDRPFRGEWFLNLDVYGKRGVGIGPGIEYSSPDLYYGYLKGYYIEDKKSIDHSTDIPIENEDRGWIQTRNRIFLRDSWILDTELSYLSEKNFLDEYFEEEIKEDKGQETLAYLHRARDSSFLSLLAKYRINDFQTDTERIPEARWDVSQIPLLGRNNLSLGDGIVFHDVYYRHQLQGAQLRYRQSDQLAGPPALPTERFNRADYLGGLEAPVSVGPVKFVPYLEQRVSFFEQTLADDHKEYRYIAGAGASASILLSRVSEARSEFLNIDGLRHILEPTIAYRNNFEADPRAYELYRFDEVDDATNSEIVIVGLRHRMQTRDSNDRARTFFEGFYSLPAYPDRDQNPTGKRYGNLAFDMLWTPDLSPAFLQNITINEEGEFSLHKEDLEALNSFVGLEPHPGFRLQASHRWIREIHSYLSFGLVYVLTPRWEMDLELWRDQETHNWMKESLILRRRAHQWVFEFEISVDRSDNDQSISLSVMPLAFFGSRKKGDFYDPMLGN